MGVSFPRSLACLVLVAGAARADSHAFDVDHLQLAVISGEFLGLEGATPALGFGFRVGAAFRYLDAPLIGDEGARSLRLISERALVDVTVSVRLGKWISLGLDLPAVVLQLGDAAMPGQALGDLRGVARLSLFGASGFSGAALLGVRVPTGATNAFLGEGQVVTEPGAALTWTWGVLRAGLNLGVRLRGVRQLGDLVVGNELYAAAGLGLRPLRFLDIFAEVHGDTGVPFQVTGSVTSVEALAGVGVKLFGVEARVAGGMGLVDGFGSPKYRAMATLSYAFDRAAKPAPVVKAPPPPPPPAPAPVLAEVAKVAKVEEVEEVAEVDDDELEVDPAEPSVQVGKHEINLSLPVFFKINTAHISSRFRDELTELASAIVKRPLIKSLLIVGHTDSTGPIAWNLHLSRLRAERVARFLVAHGVSADRLQTSAAGVDDPIASNQSEVDRAKNRRVMFRIEDPSARRADATPSGQEVGR